MVVITFLWALVFVSEGQTEPNILSNKYTTVDASNYLKATLRQGRYSPPNLGNYEFPKKSKFVSIPKVNSFQIKRNSLPVISSFGTEFQNLDGVHFGQDYSLNSFQPAVKELPGFGYNNDFETVSSPEISLHSLDVASSIPMQADFPAQYANDLNLYSNSFEVMNKPFTSSQFGSNSNLFEGTSLLNGNKKPELSSEFQSGLKTDTFTLSDAKPLSLGSLSSDHTSFNSFSPSGLPNTKQFTSGFENFKLYGLTTSGPYPDNSNDFDDYNFRIKLLNDKPGHFDYVIKKDNNLEMGTGFANGNSFRIFERVPNVYHVDSYEPNEFHHSKFPTENKIVKKPYILRIKHRYEDGSHKNIDIPLDVPAKKILKKSFMKRSSKSKSYK